MVNRLNRIDQPKSVKRAITERRRSVQESRCDLVLRLTAEFDGESSPESQLLGIGSNSKFWSGKARVSAAYILPNREANRSA